MNQEPHIETACSLEALKPGMSFVVDGVEAGGEIGKRLADMGFVKGTMGTVIRTALFGDPVQINIMGYQLSIRKSEARSIRVKKEETNE
jgi:Fe2+ transport system protein FeoA